VRIALITHYMPPHTGGVEQVAELLARIYADAGHEVQWVACANPERPGREARDGLELVRLRAFNALESRFAMPFPVPVPDAYAEIDGAVRAADVVHLHDCLYPTSIAADAAARRHRRPTLVTQHVGMVSFGGGLVDPFLFGAYRTLGRRVLRNARTVAFVSDTVREWFASRIDKSLHAETVANAVDLASFHVASHDERDRARASLGITGDQPVVLFAGRLVPKKNLRTLVAALAGGDVRLVVVGDGPERDALAPLGDRVVHLARLPHERMPEAYGAADLFALPSVGEGLPLSLVEALASGLPSVVSRDPSFDALAECDGVIRSAADPTALRDTIVKLLGEDEGSRERRAAAARSWAEARYGLVAFRRRYLELVEAAVRSGG
jgi:glycosyltransferase involved in cell wall biosynthesis